MAQSPRFQLSTVESVGPYVLAMDVGSTGTRGAIYDGTGRPLNEYRTKVAHSFTSAPDGTSVIDPGQVVDELVQVVTHLATKKWRHRIEAVAIDTFASSLVGVDDQGHAITPCYTYADSRSAADVLQLRREIDENEHQQRTGTRLHTSYLIARFRWLRRTNPELFGRVKRWMSLGEYFHLRVLGVAAAGTSTAAWTGMLDRRTADWDPTSLELAGVDRDQLSVVRPPSEAYLPDNDVVHRWWPALVGAKWFPSITDGLASNLGAGGSEPTTLVASMSTSGAMRVLVEHVPDEIPAGLWCCRVDERRSLLGGALNDVGRAVSWLRETLRLPDDDVLAGALDAEPDVLTPMVLPFFTGERSTGYQGGARALFAGISIAATGGHLYRGTLEGIALSYERVGVQLEEVATEVERIIVSGRVALDVPQLSQFLADVMGRPVRPLTIKRSTLRGTALHALEVIAPDAKAATSPLGDERAPVPAHQAYYATRKAAFARLYDSAVEAL